MKFLLVLLNLCLVASCSSSSTTKNNFTCAQGDCQNGSGRIVYANGGSYEGELQNSKAHGQGTAFYSNGDILEGQWENSYLIDGTYYYANGDQYTGTFEKTSGVDFIYGEYIWSSGQIYIGNWKGVKRHGLGVESWTDGLVYLGEHHKDQRDGPGIMFYPDGTQVGGFWENNYINTPIDNFTFENLLASLEEQPSQKMINLIEKKISIVDLKKHFSNNHSITKNITINTNPNIQKETYSPTINLYNNEYEVTSDVLTLRGFVEDESDIVVFVINGKEFQLSDDYSFETQIYVPIGESQVTITAVDEWENIKTETIKITRSYDKNNYLKAANEGLNPTVILSKKNKNRYALIFGVNRYETLTNLPFAENDANFFYDYAVNTLGIPQENIVRVVNPELKDMYIATNQIQKMINEQSDLFVYYAGHGLNYQSDNRLLASDFDVSVIQQTSLLQSEFMNMISKANPNKVALIFDTCFSGVNREGKQLVEARFISIAQSQINIPNNFSIISSSGDLEWSRDHPDLQHGLFTYHFLKGLEKEADANNDKQITLNELFSYTQRNVQQDSNFQQNPEISLNSDYLLVDWN